MRCLIRYLKSLSDFVMKGKLVRIKLEQKWHRFKVRVRIFAARYFAPFSYASVAMLSILMGWLFTPFMDDLLASTIILIGGVVTAVFSYVSIESDKAKKIKEVEEKFFRDIEREYLEMVSIGDDFYREIKENDGFIRANKLAFVSNREVSRLKGLREELLKVTGIDKESEVDYEMSTELAEIESKIRSHVERVDFFESYVQDCDKKWSDLVWVINDAYKQLRKEFEGLKVSAEVYANYIKRLYGGRGEKVEVCINGLRKNLDNFVQHVYNRKIHTEVKERCEEYDDRYFEQCRENAKIEFIKLKGEAYRSVDENPSNYMRKRFFMLSLMIFLSVFGFSMVVFSASENEGSKGLDLHAESGLES